MRSTSTSHSLTLLPVMVTSGMSHLRPILRHPLPKDLVHFLRVESEFSLNDVETRLLTRKPITLFFDLFILVRGIHDEFEGRN